MVPSRILLVRLSHLGDVVHALGVYHALHAAFPRAELAWATQPEFADLVRPLPGMVRVIPFDRRAGWRAWPRIRRELRAFAPELCVDAQANLKSAAVSLLSGAPRRVGSARADWREPLGAAVLTDPAPACTPGEGSAVVHAMHRMLALARHAAPAAASPPRLDPAPLPAEVEHGARLLDQRLPGADATSVLVKLSSSGDVRGWPAERWRALAEALGASGRGALLLAGPAERALGQRLESELADARGVSVWVEQAGLRELVGLFTAAAARGLRYVGCDSGPLHLAAACGLSTVALCGPTDAGRTGPWPLEGEGPHRVARNRPGPACAPCLRRGCDHELGPICMTELAVDEVLRLLH